MTPSRGRDLIYLLIVFVCLEKLPKMEAVECFNTEDGRMIQFTCGPSQVCCGAECCDGESSFYTHWYFWLAVCMFLMVVVGFALSACRHFRKQRKSQHCCARTKPEFGADLLLNYHLVRTDLISLPQYEDVASRAPYLVTTAAASLPPPPPVLSPPSYSDVCINSSSSNRYTPGDLCDQPPPSYSECVMQNPM